MKSIKLHSKPVYDEKYIKIKVKTFNGVANTTFGMINFLKKCTSNLYNSNIYWFCNENR